MMERKSDGIDIVIVNHNGQETLSKCLEGIFCSTTGKVNIIVVDQASTDGSREYLKKKRISHLILNSYDTGTADGKNQGIIVGRHEWICLLNPAVRITDPLWLDKMWDWTFENGIGIVEGLVETSGLTVYAGLEFCLISRRCLTEVGLFDRHLGSGGASADLLARIEWAGYKTSYCPDVKSKYLLREKVAVPIDWFKKYDLVKEKFTRNITRRLRYNLKVNKGA